MAKESDVFIENFRTGTMEKMGFGYEQMKKINPRLIYCSISGFGRTEPEKKRAGYDLLLQGYGGLMSITGDADGSPVKTGMSIVDLAMGIFAAYGILTAVIAREKTGKGQFIDASLLDGQVTLLNFFVTSYFATGRPAERMGSAHPTIVPYQAFSAKDMDIILAVPNNGLWEKCCYALNWEDLLTDSRFITNEARVSHRHELVYIINKRLSLLESKEIFECLDAAGVPCGRYSHY